MEGKEYYRLTWTKYNLMQINFKLYQVDPKAGCRNCYFALVWDKFSEYNCRHASTKISGLPLRTWRFMCNNMV